MMHGTMNIKYNTVCLVSFIDLHTFVSLEKLNYCRYFSFFVPIIEVDL